MISDWQKQIEDISGSKTFCVLPWIHFATRPNGDMRLCCNSNASGAGDNHTVGLVKNDDGIPANFASSTPMSAWNNKYMRDVRLDMLNNNIPKSCTRCFNEESKGIVSKRIWETGTWVRDGLDVRSLIDKTEVNGVVPEKLVYLDLRLGHTCNLKCVMCSPHDSSQWVTEHKKIYPIFTERSLKEQMNWDQSSFNNVWYESPSFWGELYEQIPNIKQVYFAGGEPLMIKEHKRFLEEIINRGYNKEITLRYNSNGLFVSEEIIDLWSKFKLVKFNFSIDAIGQRNYYIRYPTDWDIVVCNLQRLDNTPDNIQVNIAVAVQILNIKHLPEFAKWVISKQFKKVNMNHIIDGISGELLTMHLLYIPTWLSIRCLPEQDKQHVRYLFNEFSLWLYEHYKQDKNFWNVNPYGWKRWEAILEFMDSEDHSHELSAFKEYFDVLDKQRNTNFKQTFPELQHLC